MSPSSERIARSQNWLIAAIGGMTIGVFVLDSLFPLGFVVPALYLVPLTLTTRVRRAMAPFVVAACVTALTLAGIWTNWTSPVVSLELGLFNRLLVILACWIAATIIWHTTQKYAREELETLIADRTAALQQSETTLRESQAQLRQLTAQLLSAQDDERRRIARELHDELNQRVISLAFDVDDQMQREPSLPAAARTILQIVKNKVAELSDHLRALAHRLHPSVLDDLGITSALRVCAQEFEQREHVPVRVALEESHRPLDRHLADCLFRVTQEALRNVAKHAGAMQVRLALSYDEDHVLLTIEDDGRGFAPQGRYSLQRGLGLVSMGERVRLLEGALTLSSDPGRGTRVSVSIPLTGISNEQTSYLAR
jgi:signal transduction histidine kinase